MTRTELKTALIFGTDTGNTEEVGNKILSALGEQGIVGEKINVNEVSKEEIENYDFLIFGIPTWDFGGIQEDWEEFEEEISSVDLTHRTVALYGLGDQLGYGHYFVDAMGWLYEKIENSGANIIGGWKIEGYFFEESRAANEDKTHFCGLAIDEDQQFELTDERVSRWVEQLLEELSLSDAA